MTTITVYLPTRAAVDAWLVAHSHDRVTLTVRPDGTVLGRLIVADEERT